MIVRNRNATKTLMLLGWIFCVFAIPQASFAQDDEREPITFLDQPRGDFGQILSILGEAAGVSIIPGPEVKGQVAVYLRDVQAIDALEEIVRAHGFRMVREGNTILIMTEDRHETYYGTDLEIRVYQLKFGRATQLQVTLLPSMSTRGRAVADSNNNQLVVSDLPWRFEGIEALIEKLDIQGTMRIFTLEHALVSDLREILQSLVGDPSKLKIDQRTNRLIIIDTPERLDFFGEIIKELDLEDLTETRTYTLKYVPAEEIVPILEEIISGNRPERNLLRGTDRETGPFVGTTRRNAGATGGIVPNATTRAARAPRAQQSENRSSLSRSTTRQGIASRSQRPTQSPVTGDFPTPIVAPVLAPVLPGGANAGLFDIEARALGVAGTIIADGRTNTLIITHAPAILNRIEPIIESLDVERKFHMYQFQEADISQLDLERRLAEILPDEEPEFQVDIGTSTVLFRAPDDAAEHIFEILETWDQAPRQVFIEARILRVKLEVIRDLGVTIRALDTSDDGGDLRAVVDSLFPPDIPGSPQGLFQFGDLTKDEYTVILQALENEGSEDLLSTPKVTVIDRAQAHFAVAIDEPFVEIVTDANSDITRDSTRFIEVGVILDVIPVISAGGKVLMQVHVEIGRLVGRIANGAPIVDRSEADSVVLVEDGHTLAMGGLIIDSETGSVNKIPFLGDIPWIGKLFQNSNKDTEKFEIVIFISPVIIGAGDARLPPDRLLLEDIPGRGDREPVAWREPLSKSALPESY